MRRAAILTAVAGAGLLTIGLAAQLPQNPMVPNFGPVERIDKMADNLYFVPGAGGNTAVFVHANGVLLVDTKVPKSGQALTDIVRRVSDKPITHIVNTHTHFDHAGSNPEFPASVEIVTHANTKANLAKMDPYKDAAGQKLLPDRTFKDRMTILSGKDAVDLYYFGAGHTNGDAFIVFRNARAMHAGDLFAQNGGALIDRNNGGSAIALPDTLAKAAAGIRNVDRVITGHASVVTWQGFLDYRDFHRLAMAHARASLAAGKTAEQALAEFKPPAKFKDFRYGQAGQPAASGSRPPSLPPAIAAIATQPPGGYFGTIYQDLKK